MTQALQVPNADYPFVDNNNLITLPWRQFIAGLFERTGGTSGGVAVPTGQVATFAGVSPPDGWLLCDGSAISRTIFANLFASIGTTWGSGDGTSTFNIPNLVGRFPYGAEASGPYSVGGQGGSNSTTLTTNQLPVHSHPLVGKAHTHTINDPGHLHTITDPGHDHAITDPTHDHTITDPGHVHTVGSSAIPVAGTFAVQSATDTGDVTTDMATTGISVDKAATGVTVDSNVTLITVDSAVTDITINPATSNSTVGTAGLGQSYDSRPAFSSINYIIKT